MRFLFLHNNFPAQYRHIIQELAKDPANQVFFVTKAAEPQIPGVTKLIYKPSRDPHNNTHHYLLPLENSVLHGQAVFVLMEKLKKQGFVPDVMCGHSGWGPTLFLKDAFPQTPLMCYFEWFYNMYGSDMDFDKQAHNIDDMARIRIKNASILVELYSCDRGLSPTNWQKNQFPKEFHDKISVMHDGVDTDYFVPDPGAKLVIPNLDLSGVDEIVTYVARGMEPYRGFPQFMESLVYLQEQRPNCHAVIVGSERVCYGRALPNNQTFKQLMLNKLPNLDLSRIHFTGSLPYNQYLKVIQASSVHVYLTYPFVLSWSAIESMSTGCLVLGSDTQPVHEVITDGENGLLVDFFNPKAVADRISEVLDHPTRMADLRVKARQTVLDRYALKDLLPKQLEMIKGLA